jgi:hypothetical protein
MHPHTLCVYENACVINVICGGSNKTARNSTNILTWKRRSQCGRLVGAAVAAGPHTRPLCPRSLLPAWFVPPAVQMLSPCRQYLRVWACTASNGDCSTSKCMQHFRDVSHLVKCTTLSSSTICAIACHPYCSPALFTSTSSLPPCSLRSQSASAVMDVALVMSSACHVSLPAAMAAAVASCSCSFCNAARPRSSAWSNGQHTAACRPAVVSFACAGQWACKYSSMPASTHTHTHTYTHTQPGCSASHLVHNEHYPPLRDVMMTVRPASASRRVISNPMPLLAAM